MKNTLKALQDQEACVSRLYARLLAGEMVHDELDQALEVEGNLLEAHLRETLPQIGGSTRIPDQVDPLMFNVLLKTLKGFEDQFEREPVVDGFKHSVEDPLDALPWANFGEEMLTLLVASPFFQSFLILLGRLEIPQLLRVQLVQIGLASPSLDVRDAAIQAVENWGGESLVNLLRGHTESVPWLSQYLEQVIQDHADFRIEDDT